MQKKFFVVFPIVCAIGSVALTLTFLLTVLNKGLFHPHFFLLWIRSFIPTACVMAPSAAMLAMFYGKIVDTRLISQSAFVKKIILAIMMGCSIELLVSGINILTTTTLSFQVFGTWLLLYIKALPLGICVGLAMSFIIRPWISARLALLEEPSK